MSRSPSQIVFDRVANSAEDVGQATLLGVSLSMKPAVGRDARSAVRNLLCHSLATVGAIYADVRLLDLRAHPLPLFDGRPPDDVANAEVALVHTCLQRAGGVLFGVPAYWSGVSGVFKNLVDVTCGPAYDLPEPVRTVFTGKPVGLLIVGADATSASDGARNAEQIMVSTGARVIGRPVILSNPRRATEADFSASLCDLLVLASELARCIVAAQAVEQ